MTLGVNFDFSKPCFSLSSGFGLFKNGGFFFFFAGRK